MKSTVEIKVDIADRLVQVPLDDRPDAIALVKGLVKVVFYEEEVGNIWLTVAVTGYSGKDESLNRLRELWRRSFPEPLPPSHRLGLRDYGDFFSFSLGGKTYKFGKFDCSYLGCAAEASTA